VGGAGAGFPAGDKRLQAVAGGPGRLQQAEQQLVEDGVGGGVRAAWHLKADPSELAAAMPRRGCRGGGSRCGRRRP
jgi:hypothetical protein